MLNRNALALVAGAAIFALDASAASAQDTTRARPTSAQRISIRKDSPGEVVPPRVDTVFSYRTDTLRLPGHTDTVTTTRTVVRVDTVTVQVPLVLRAMGGFYFGLAAGSSMPAANFNDSDHPGWRLEGMLGLDPIGSPFGARLSAAYSAYQPHSWVEPVIGNAAMFTAALDAKVRLLALAPLNRRLQIYGIAGGSYNRFKDILETDHSQLSVGDNLFLPGQLGPADNSWHSGWGYNLGGGAELGFGRMNVFAETRFSSFQGKNTMISHVPVLVGVSWF